MKTLLSILVLAIVSTATAHVAFAQGAPPIIPAKDRKFEHKRHEDAAKAKGKTAECSTCHVVDKESGKVKGRNHDRCDNAGCHNLDHDKQSAQFVTDPVAEQCFVCHKPTKARPGLIGQKDDKAFTAKFAHNVHMQMGETIKSSCAACHEAEVVGNGGQAMKGDAHDQCNACHTSKNKKVNMSQCSGCHVAIGQGNVAHKDEFSLIPFDHGNHRNKSHVNNQECAACHAGVGDKKFDDNNLPKPAMETCYQTCHNGSKAFNAVGTKCTQCHKPAGQGPSVPTKGEFSFSHNLHRGRPNTNIDDCAQCHSVQKDGKIDAPGIGKDHQPCAKSGCHDKEFYNKTPKICAACHDAASPWAKATPRLRQHDGQKLPNEFFGTINHNTHIKLAGDSNAQCMGCHGNKLADAPGPKEHEGCATGGKCHGGNQAPAMNDCRLCHKATKAERAPVSEWTVAATFKHSIHGTDPRTKGQTSCTSCHNTVKEATDLKSLKLPAMKQCDSCHDGKTSFKTTGFECAKCHRKGTAGS